MIFELTRKCEEEIEPQEYVTKIILAKSEIEAREIANKNTSFEGKIWTDIEKVECTEIITDSESRVIVEIMAD